MVGLAGRNAARGDDEVMLRRRCGNRAREPLGIVGQDAEIGRGGAEALDEPSEQIAIGVEQRGTRSRVPGSTISSPVENTATRTRRNTSSAVRPMAAASATCCAASRRPAGSTIDPARTSSPARRRFAPTFSPAGTITALPSRRTSSCMKTVSAPAGMGAPVKMRTAAPASRTRAAARPAVTRSTTASRVSALASRSAWRTA